MEHSIVPFRSREVALILEYTAPSDPLSVLQTAPDAEINTSDPQDKNNRTRLFQVGKCVAMQPNTEASVFATTTSVGHI